MNSELLSLKLNDVGFTIVACSEIGQGKIENQDSYKVYADDTQIIVVVADGLGSAPFSKEGSRKIVDIAVELLQKHVANSVFPAELRHAWKDQISGNPNLYDTTVKFIQITSDKTTIGGVGDGWIALNGDDSFYSTEYSKVFSNQTDSIMSFDLSERFFYKEFDTNTIKTLLISTDGFSEDIEKDNGKAFLEEIEAQMISAPQSFETELRQTLENWPIETNKDDKTVVIIQRSVSNE